MEDYGSAMAPRGLRAEGAADEYMLPEWFGRSDLLDYGAGLDPPVRPEVASRAFGVLVANCADLGLEVRCGFAVHRPRHCPAPHWVKTAGFLATPGESVLAARGCGKALGELLADFRSQLSR